MPTVPDAAGGGRVGGALERIERELSDADWAAARDEHGDATTLRTSPHARHADTTPSSRSRSGARRAADGKRPRRW